MQFRYRRELEPPDPAEGFSRIETISFERTRDATFTSRALILWCDGVLSLRRRTSTEKGYGPFAEAPDCEKGPYPFSADVLRRYARDGWRVLGLDWQPAIAQEVVTAEQVEAGYARMQERLGVPMDILYCPHGGGPPICWCRKPLPGLGVVFIQRYRLDPSQCIYVGNGPQDPAFARRLGFQYRDAADFLGLQMS